MRGTEYSFSGDTLEGVVHTLEIYLDNNDGKTHTVKYGGRKFNVRDGMTKSQIERAMKDAGYDFTYYGLSFKEIAALKKKLREQGK